MIAAQFAHGAMLVDSVERYLPPTQTPESQDDNPQELFPLTEAPSEEPPRTELPSLQTEQQRRELRAKVLNDFASRIREEFHVPEPLRARTEFWFDIYTHYGEAHHIIHHVLYPWIVYKVVDTTEILQNGKGPFWLRKQQAEIVTKRELQNIRYTLNRLARKREYTSLTPQERELYDRLLPVKGPRRSVFMQAAANVRSQLGQKTFFEKGLVNSSRYLPYMEEEFKRMGLPTELTRMPFVESSFNEGARSKVGASGIWQIMPQTGKAYMIVSPTIDERNSPIKATHLAGRLLHSYNHALASWPLTITSYNHGIGNIQKAIRQARTRDLAEIITRYHRGDFKFASSNFYTCFLAALYAERYNELIFKNTPREPLQEREILRLSGPTRIKHLEKLTGLDAKTLTAYNLDLKYAVRGNVVLPRGYQLHLPPGHKDRLLERIGKQDARSKPST